MNQTQRKYASQRISAISERRKKALVDSFNSNPENKLRVIPNQENHTTFEMLNAILRQPSRAVLKSREELLSLAGPYTYLSSLFQPMNFMEIEIVKNYNRTIVERRAIEIDAQIAAIDRQAQEALDAIILGDNEEAIAAITRFESLVNR